MAKRIHKKKKHQLPARLGDSATPERKKQLGGVETVVVDCDATGRASTKCDRARLECMLDYYWQTRKITNPQRKAGFKFREIYLRAAHLYSVRDPANPFLSDPKQSDPEWRTLNHIECVEQLALACKKLSEEQFMIVRNVCGYDRFAGGRINKRKFDRALDILAKHWGFL